MSDPQRYGGELHFNRELNAPRELVFRCMIDPEHLTHFWGPLGMSTPLETITVDARPGGAFETVMVNDNNGSRYPVRAVFDIVDAPETLAWTESATGMHVTVRFTSLDAGRTRVDIDQARVPEAAMSPEAQSGFLTALDRFELHLKHLQQPRGENQNDDPRHP